MIQATPNNPEQIILVDRRKGGDRRDNESPQAKNHPQRRKQQRRRHIDPTTCERDYRAEEIEFMQAMDEYKRSSGRMFPTCSEVLEVLRGLGYTRLSAEQQRLLGGGTEVTAATQQPT